MTGTLSPGTQMVKDFRDMTTGDGTYANIAALAESVSADPACVGVLACVTVNRETPPVLVPNQTIALELLEAADVDADYAGYGYCVQRFTHWAVGWVDYVIINTQRTEVVEACADIMRRLDAYPLLDEMRCVEHEWEANHPNDGECYSEEGEHCPCHEWEGEPASVANPTANATERNTQ